MDVDEKTAAAILESCELGPRRKPRVTEADVLEALRLRYQAPEWAFLSHVPNGTGSQKTREIDAVAMNLWPSRGCALLGFEVKVTRADWQRELLNPRKAEEGLGLCDAAWVVAPAGVVQKAEVPASWGALELGADGRFSVLKEPEARLVRVKVFPRGFVAALLRAAARVAPEAQIEEARSSGEQSGIAEGREIERKISGHFQERLKELEAKVAAFEEASGIKIVDHWGAGPARVGAVVREVLHGGHSRALARLRGMEQELERLAASVRETIQRQEEDHD